MAISRHLCSPLKGSQLNARGFENHLLLLIGIQCHQSAALQASNQLGCALFAYLLTQSRCRRWRDGGRGLEEVEEVIAAEGAVGVEQGGAAVAGGGFVGHLGDVGQFPEHDGPPLRPGVCSN